MTEELKEQIHERVYNIKVPTLGFSRRDLFNIAMEYAEPREKRIAELEKENERLTVSYETLKLHDEEEIGMLKSENAELKLKLEALEGQTPWKDIKDKSEVIGQLTNAKEIISEYINILKGDTKNWKKTQEKAEQFLKETE